MGCLGEFHETVQVETPNTMWLESKEKGRPEGALKFKQKTVCMEDINYGGPRKSERQSFVQGQREPGAVIRVTSLLVI